MASSVLSHDTFQRYGVSYGYMHMWKLLLKHLRPAEQLTAIIDAPKLSGFFSYFFLFFLNFFFK
jgi:hypothetical protein